ncbi:hypothetical protein [Helicobacter pylori]|uniref:hypothetical protein n=1 Tax=Helicobacter pylori TaxID=210 RepID=UPI000988EF49|nr:hypothetical protein [Helicobacter pylori]OOC30809.1 hypothetical protein BZK22_00660 [Helicobacter pylori]
MENQGVRSFGFLRLLIFLFKALTLSIFRVEMLFKIVPLAQIVSVSNAIALTKKIITLNGILNHSYIRGFYDF